MEVLSAPEALTHTLRWTWVMPRYVARGSGQSVRTIHVQAGVIKAGVRGLNPEPAALG